MLPSLATITLPTGERFDLGPLPLAWHGLFTALGIIVAAALALRFARERKLDPDRLTGLMVVIVIAGLIGARLLYLIEQEPSALSRPGDWLGTNGFSFYGAILAAVPAALLYLRRAEQPLALLDAAAVGFGLGMAVGRIGDLLIGEHLGEPSTLPWAVRYSNPDSMAPSTDLAYQPGPLYESLLGLIIFAIVWPRRQRFRTPGVLLATVVGAYSAGRFVLFFFRNDSDQLLLGMSNGQTISLLLALASAMAIALLRRPRPATSGP